MSQGKRRNKQQLILQVSIALFAARGYDGVSVRDVARAARVTMPTLYHHFGDKRSLYLAACTALFRQWSERHGAILRKQGPARQRLFDYVASVCASLLRDRPFAALLQREILERDRQALQSLTQQVFREHFEMVTVLCRSLRPGGKPTLLAHTVYALAFGIAQLQPIGSTLAASTGLRTAEAMAGHVLRTALPEISWGRIARRQPVQFL